MRTFFFPKTLANLWGVLDGSVLLKPWNTYSFLIVIFGNKVLIFKDFSQNIGQFFTIFKCLHSEYTKIKKILPIIRIFWDLRLGISCEKVTHRYHTFPYVLIYEYPTPPPVCETWMGAQPSTNSYFSRCSYVPALVFISNLYPFCHHLLPIYNHGGPYPITLNTLFHKSKARLYTLTLPKYQSLKMLVDTCQ